MTLEVAKLQVRDFQPSCWTTFRSAVSVSVSSLLGVGGTSMSWASSSVSNAVYPGRCRIEVSGGGNWCRTEMSCAVAVPEGKASCSSIMTCLRIGGDRNTLHH